MNHQPQLAAGRHEGDQKQRGEKWQAEKGDKGKEGVQPQEEIQSVYPSDILIWAAGFTLVFSFRSFQRA